MKLGSRRPTRGVLAGAVGITVVCLLGAALAGGQVAPEQKPQLAEEAFKNVQVMRGIPVNEFMESMGFFASSLGENCTYCHVEESGGDWARYADDNDHKRMARMMILMMNGINKTYFAGKRQVTCYSCHRGESHPEVTPNLAVQYGPPPTIEPDTLQPTVDQGPSVDAVFAKYIHALGGASALSKITSVAAKGTYMGYADTDKQVVDLFAKAPDRRAQIVHGPFGDMTTAFNGTEGWFAAPNTDRPIPVVPLTDGDVNGARLDAQLIFPAQIKDTLKDWRVTYPTQINDKDVTVVQGTADGRTPINMYFDSTTGLLIRYVRYAETPTGFVPTQVDLSEYRLAGGVKMPFHIVTTWTDGRSVMELTSIQPNAKVDDEKFGMPPIPVMPPPKPAAKSGAAAKP